MTTALVQRSYTRSAFAGASLFTQHRITITETDGSWRPAVMQRLEELVRLDPGWDGYDGVPVSLENAAFALSMLEATCRANTSPPQIVPGSNGDLQIEWHTERVDVELLIRGPYNVRAWCYFVDADNQDGEEIHVTTDYLPVARWIAQAMEPRLVGLAAA